MSNYYEKMKLEMELRGYSTNTQKHYSSQVRLLEKYLDKPPDQILPDEIKEYLHHQVKSGVSYSNINIACNAFKVLFNLVLHRNFSDDVIIRPKKLNKLPYTISREKILSILEHISSPKHRTFLSILMSTVSCPGAVFLWMDLSSLLPVKSFLFR